MPESKPVIYIVVGGEFPGGDVAGFAVASTGVLWEHLSSNRAHLRVDLTDGFPSRATVLNGMFPDGYDVVMVDRGDPVPGAISKFVTPAPAEIDVAEALNGGLR